MSDGGVVQCLSTAHGGDGMKSDHTSPLLASNRDCGSSSSTPAEDDDIQPFNGVADVVKEFFTESKNLWYLAGPVIFTSFCNYGLITITQTISGHLGTNQLAAVSVENSIISGLTYGLMLGMSSALETYCGQAFGANQYDMLGIYMQRAWVILSAMAFASLPLFIFATPVLKFLGQTASVSREAGRFALWMIPENFAYAITLPSNRFLQAQSKVIVLAVIAAAALCVHAFLSWLLIKVLQMELVGAALALDASWWFIATAQFLFIISGRCGEAWSGFSWKAFQDLWRFFKMSVASALISCMELLYVLALTLFAGYLEDAEISIDAFSICINVLGWASTVAIGLNVAASVRVSNELGCGHPRKSRFAVVVSGASSLLIGLVFTLVLIITRKQYPAIFSNSSQVQQLAEQLTTLLGITIVFTNVQSTLQGVAIGAGWQVHVAYMSIGSYFVFGVPLGILMIYKFEMGLKGLWCGMVIGLCLQTGLVMWMIWSANWNKECFKAEERVKQWRKETCVEENGYD